MTVLKANFDPQSEIFKKNRDGNLALINELNRQLHLAQNQSSEKAIAKFEKAGKLLTRERLEKLIDAHSYFLEFSPLAALDSPQGETTGAACITGLAMVSGRAVVILSSDPLVKGGAVGPTTVEKYLRAQEFALAAGLPSIYLVESAGANLNLAAEVFVPGGKIFRNITQASALGLPQLAVVFGSSTAGGAYIPALCDSVILVEQQATLYLGGPPLVKLATNEIATDEELGGAKMHCEKSGVGDYLAKNDEAAIAIARDIVETWHDFALHKRVEDNLPPLYDAENILGIVSPDPKYPFSMRDVLACLLDGSELDEFKKDYGPTLITGFAKIFGLSVGIVANDGILFSDSAQKATHFIELCEQRRISIVYLVNVTGFMVGQLYEEGGIIKHGANMINAVANCTVPQLTVIIGGAYGAGYYAMCGRPFNPRLIVSWPTSKTAIMGPEQGAGVLALVHKASLAKEGKCLSREEEENFKSPIREMFMQQANPYHATSRLHDDGIIDPRDTRRVLAAVLSVGQKIETKKRRGIYRF